jgi:SAM-dependent methyltransferase
MPPPLATTVHLTPEYWDAIADEWEFDGQERAWRMVSDAVNARMLRHWLTPVRDGRVLKTDLFDEVVGSGLVPWLSSGFSHVSGIDISTAVVDVARARFPRLDCETADVRDLPFDDESFDAVVSNSTLDHFPTAADIAVAIGELHRVLRRGGSLVVTLDNPLNPVVALRNALPPRVRAATGMVPFAVGATLGPRKLRALLDRTGFDVIRMSAVSHSPRVFVVLVGHLFDGRSVTTKRRYVRAWSVFEGLAALPTRYLTGYFVAAHARKR